LRKERLNRAALITLFDARRRWDTLRLRARAETHDVTIHAAKDFATKSRQGSTLGTARPRRLGERRRVDPRPG